MSMFFFIWQYHVKSHSIHNRLLSLSLFSRSYWFWNSMELKIRVEWKGWVYVCNQCYLVWVKPNGKKNHTCFVRLKLNILFASFHFYFFFYFMIVLHVEFNEIMILWYANIYLFHMLYCLIDHKSFEINFRMKAKNVFFSNLSHWVRVCVCEKESNLAWICL